ncbi:hypothetical protein [Nonomuraea typhae]|nr:hypothetical protein [Nonomuraea typhae]
MDTTGLASTNLDHWWEVICTSPACDKAAYAAKWADNRILK